MTFSLWLSLLGASLLISFTPGAGAINTMNNALNAGFGRSFWGILGQQAALLVHVLVVAAGVGVLVANSPIAFAVVRYLGAAYLVYLGIGLLRAKPDPDTAAVDVRAHEPAASMFRRGLWVNLLNPKAIVFAPVNSWPILYLCRTSPFTFASPSTGPATPPPWNARSKPAGSSQPPRNGRT